VRNSIPYLSENFVSKIYLIARFGIMKLPEYANKQWILLRVFTYFIVSVSSYILVVNESISVPLMLVKFKLLYCDVYTHW
jgi:hypothetical protein